MLQQPQAEAKYTRKLLEAISDDKMDYKPDYKSSNMANVSTQIVESYHGYVPGFQQNKIEFATYDDDKSDTSNLANILERLV